MAYKDLVTLALYAGLRHQNAACLLTALTALGALLLLTPCLILLFMLLRLFLVSCQVVPLSDEPQSILGKPLLFPVQLNHVRFNPVKDQFANRFLMIGIPVGIRARYGNLLAIDDKRMTLRDSTHDGPSWRSFLAQATCWLSVDGERYLHRGDQNLDMRAKLDRFLRKENEDPSQWPYAYLLTVPRFFWWSRSVVTWWYLYNADRELDAMIMEINNSYDEKRNYFFRVERGESPIPATENGNTTGKQFLDNACTIRSASSQPKSTYYKGTWQKFIFASPFEKVDGAIANRFMDLAHGARWKPNATLLNTNTLSPEGKVKMVTRITCCGLPLDPAQMGFKDLARIALQWTLPGVLTTPYIVLEALRIRWKGLMKMMDKTPVRSGSIGRHPTRAERQLEPYFRAYLAHCVSSFPGPVELAYIPCRAFSDETIHMRSPSCTSGSTSVRTVTIEVLDPSFYTRIVNYPIAWEGLSTEMRATGQEADTISQNIAVSNPELLQKIVGSSPASKDKGYRPGSGGFLILKWCRWSSTPSFMDTFVASEQTPSMQKKYAMLAVRYLLASGVAYSPLILDALVDVLLFMVSVMGRAGLLEVVLRQRRMTEWPMDVAAQTLMSAGVYFAGMRGVGAVRDRLFSGQA